MKGKIHDGATHEAMAAHAETVEAGKKGVSAQCDHAECKQRGWIINGCYWCGEDGCVNPWWISAQCSSCGKWYAVNR